MTEPWSNQGIALLIIEAGGGFTGLFVYSGAPAGGNLISSIAPAVGTDPFGNAYLDGIVSYGTEITLGTGVAVRHSDLGITWWTGPTGGGGPWTEQFLIFYTDAGGAQALEIAANPVVFTNPVQFGADVILSRSAAGVLQLLNSLVIEQANANPGTLILQGIATLDAHSRFQVETTGGLHWGPGTAVVDSALSRTAANQMSFTTADLRIGTAGRGLQITEGTNARMGASVLVAGSVVVSNTTITANTRIFLTCQTPGGTPGFLRVSARTAGTSFTILSSSGTDTSTVGWLLVEPG